MHAVISIAAKIGLHFKFPINSLKNTKEIITA